MFGRDCRRAEHRHRNRPRRSNIWGFAALLLAAAPARAQPLSADAEPEALPEQVQLDYVSGAGCPNKALFVNEVKARIRRPVAWVAMNGAFSIIVSLNETQGEAVGRLELARGGAEATRREFTAASCQEVGSALALVVALALDPNARTDPLPPTELTEPLPPEENAPAPAPLPPSPPTAVEAAAAPRPSPASPKVAPRPPLRYAVWFGPAAGVDGGYAPEPLVTVGVSLGARVTLGSSFSPALQLTPLWGRTGSTGPAAEFGTFAWSMARLEACPVDFQLAKSLRLVPCLAGELGRLSARGRGSELYEATAVDRFWGAAGVTVALHLNLGSWFVRGSGEAIFPATRDEFLLRDPDRSVHRASAIGLGGRLGLGFQLGR
jgi:hypothetical protein